MTIQETLTKLLSFRSVTTDQAACLQLLEWVKSQPALASFTASLQEHEGVHSLLLTTGSKEPSLLLVSHIDVVEAEEQQFSLTRQGDKLIGRGTYDMLFAVAAYLNAVEILGAEAKNFDFGILLTSDEEHGGFHGAGEMVKQLLQTKVAVVPDGGKNWELITNIKGVYQVEITRKGVSAHGSRPWEGNNPISALLTDLQKIEAWFRATFPDPKITTSCAVTVVGAGKSVNRIPEIASASLDIRYSTQAELQQVQEFLAKEQLPIRVIAEAREVSVAPKNSFIQKFREIAKQQGKEMLEGRQTGSNDGRFFSAEGIPTIIFRPAGGGHHGPKEWVSAAETELMAQIIAEYIQEFPLTD